MRIEEIIYHASRGFARGLVEALRGASDEAPIPEGVADSFLAAEPLPASENRGAPLPDIDYGADIIDIPFDPLQTEQAGENRVHFVSRHSIAETGLTCPSCGQMVAPRASFDRVQKARLSDGSINEVLYCPHDKVHEGRKVKCGAILVASPDTEHGDHLNEKSAKNYTFKRKDKALATQEAYGADVRDSDRGTGPELSAIHPVQPDLMKNARAAAGLSPQSTSPADGATGIAWSDLEKKDS